MSVPAAGAPAPPPGMFRVGRVFASAYAILSQNLIQFMLLSGLTSLPYILVYGSLYDLSPRRTVTTVGAQVTASAVWSGPQIAAVVLGFALTAFCQAVVVYGAFQVMRNRTFRFGESVGKGLARFLPVIATVICMIVSYMLGAILLVIPAFILMSMFYVSLPACVVEQLGPFKSLSRSVQLTKGHRWKVFGILMVLLIAVAILGNLLAALLKIVDSPIVLIVVMFLWNTLARAVESVVAVVAYHDLRVAKEGVDIEHIASVFD
jgi:hypothetical protein